MRGDPESYGMDIVQVVHWWKNKLTFIGSRPSDHYFRSVCWFVCLSVCLFVQSFSQPSLIRFRSNLDVCYVSGSSCVPYNIGAVRPLGAGRPLKTGIFRGFGAQKTISSYSFDRIVLILVIL